MMRFAFDKNNNRVCIDDVDRNDICYCQECGEKLVQKRGEIKIHHFSHYPNTKCTDKWHYDESDWHYDMQMLFSNDSQEIVMELDGEKHRADVFIKEQNLVAIFQGDRIRQTEFTARNDFFTKLGYRIIWLFDQSRTFEQGSIDNANVNKCITRKWLKSSKTFYGFYPEEMQNIEVWFAKRHKCEDEPNYFRILSADKKKGFGIMNCSHCYSKSEFIKYVKCGIKTIDKSILFDLHWSLRRTDGLDYFYCCPLSEANFIPIEECFGCEYCECLKEKGIPNYVECSGRCRKIDLGRMADVLFIERNDEGFIIHIKGETDDGVIENINVDTPSTCLRTLFYLWEKYKPLRYLYCFNVKTKRIVRVFNPGWQTRTTGIIKGNVVYKDTIKQEVEICDADQPIWIVTNFIRPNQES